MGAVAVRRLNALVNRGEPVRSLLIKYVTALLHSDHLKVAQIALPARAGVAHRAGHGFAHRHDQPMPEASVIGERDDDR